MEVSSLVTTAGNHPEIWLVLNSFACSSNFLLGTQSKAARRVSDQLNHVIRYVWFDSPAGIVRLNVSDQEIADVESQLGKHFELQRSVY